MPAYVAQANLLRVWRTDIAGLKQADVADYLGTNKATVSMWENARRGITFAALHALDECYGADGALSDMAQALGTPAGLPARRAWTRYPSGSYGTGWVWLRPEPGGGSLDATLAWGPLSFRWSSPCDDRGVLLQLPITAPDVVVAVVLDAPGWVDFGRSHARPQLGIPVHEVPGSPRLSLDGRLPPDLVGPRLARRFTCERAFAAAVEDLFGCRPDLVRQAFAVPSRAPAPAEPLTVDRPYATATGPGPCGSAGSSGSSGPSVSAGSCGSRGFSGADYRRLRHGRCLTLADAAGRATALLPDEPVTPDQIRRFERGARPQARLLRSRLDHVYEAGGSTCDERIPIGSYRSPFKVTFPSYWAGPVWFAFDADGDAPARIGLHCGASHQELLVVPGASVTCERCADEHDPVVVVCPYGWTVTAGLGARPDAPSLRSPRFDAPVAPGPDEVDDDLLSLFGRTRKDVEDLLQRFR
jgi:hypothetical protein